MAEPLQSQQTISVYFAASVRAAAAPRRRFPLNGPLTAAGFESGLAYKSYNGTSDFNSKALDLSGQNKVTVSFFLWVNLNETANKVAAEFTADSFGTAGGFGVLPNRSPAKTNITMSSAGTVWADIIPTPTAARWHHWLVTFNRVTPLNSVWIDGVAQTLTADGHGVITGNFANDTLWLMARSPGSSFNIAGRFAKFCLWDSTVSLSAAQIAQLAAGVFPGEVQAAGIIYAQNFSGSGQATHLSSSQRIGPFAPQVQDPLPTQEQQTITTALAVRAMREQIRRFPWQDSRGQPIRESTKQTANAEPMAALYRLVGPHPPQIVRPGPSLEMQKPTVRLAAIQTRLQLQRKRFPLQGWTGHITRQTGQGTASVFGDPARLLGPRPPVIVRPAPLQSQQTITVKSVAVEIQGRLDRPLRRRPWNVLPSAPQVIFHPVDLNIPVYDVVQATAQDKWHRPPFSVLRPPAVVEPRLQMPDRRLRIAVTLAGRTRLEMLRRGPHSRKIVPATLEPESVELKEQTISTTLVAVRSRIDRIRRGPHSRQIKPSTLEPFPVQLRQRTIRVYLAGRTRLEEKRRRGRVIVIKPATLRPKPVELAIAVTLTRIRPPRKRAFLRPPVVIGEPVVVVTFPGPTVVLAPSRRPPVKSRLQPPTVTTEVVFSGPRTWLVRIRPPFFGRFRFGPFIPFIPHHGHVCGDDSTDVQDMGLDSMPTNDCGTDTAEVVDSGLSSSPTKITGASSSNSAVCGTDQEAS